MRRIPTSHTHTRAARALDRSAGTRRVRGGEGRLRQRCRRCGPHTDAPAITIPEYFERPDRFERLWHLQKNGRAAECAFWTHPIGAEIRLQVGNELVRSEAGRDPMALFDLAMSWKSQFVEKGWR